MNIRVDRRLAIRRAARALAMALVAWSMSTRCDAAEAVPANPNIVFVLFDDIGYGQPTCYRAESPFRTPNINRLAREGMRFTDAHSAASVCTPTRYGLLTGRYPARIGQFTVLTTYSPPIIPADRLTVASMLKQRGYHTACVGKWHLGLNWVDGKPGEEDKLPIGARLTDGPNAIGFDYFFGFTHARNFRSLIEQDAAAEYVAPVENQPRMIEKAIAYIGERAKTDQRFFLYFPMCPPHNPIVPAPEFIGAGGVSGEEARYADWVYQGDHMLGQILEALDRHGLADDTLVIATGDNGAASRPYPPLRDAKGSIYEGGHREPFVARWPGKIAAGSTCDATICLNDFFATCAEIVGEDLPDNAGEDSVSFLPHLVGAKNVAPRGPIVHQSYRQGIAIRDGDWKLIFAKSGERELYNLRSDIGETQNVLAKHPDVAARLTIALQQIIDRGRSTPGAVQANEFAWTIPAKVNKE